MHQLTWAPFNGVYFACYEETKQALARRKLLDEGVAMNVCSGVVAGVVASVSTSPIDLVKTRLQVQRSNPEIFDYKVRREWARESERCFVLMFAWKCC